MGKFINRGNEGFRKYVTDDYMDKTELLEYLNSTLNTPLQFHCVSRPRRIGKTLSAQMIYAYYDKSTDSSELFSKFYIAQTESYRQHLNKYHALYIDITDFIMKYKGQKYIAQKLQDVIIKDILEEHPWARKDDDEDLMDILYNIVQKTGDKFIIIIDEWDALCRELSNTAEETNQYVGLLRRMFKGGNSALVFAGAYMTGILPIKKYGTQSALNDFRESSMTSPGPMADYIGLNDSDVKKLSERYGIEHNDLKYWYNGYELFGPDWHNPKSEPEAHFIYNSNSVIQACHNHFCENYWTKTFAFSALQQYIDMDFDNVSETLRKLVGDEPVRLNAIRYGNDNNVVNSNDELFTLLTHLGYVCYNPISRTIRIPNQEVREEFTEALRGSKTHKELSAMVKASDELLEATFCMAEDYVANALDELHRKNTAPKFYNDEQALRSVVRFAYISACENYISIQELASGHGYADIVYIPRRNSGNPLMVIELKWDKSAESAITQIRNRHYPDDLMALSNGEVLLVGINYNPATKKHECKIERF